MTNLQLKTRQEITCQSKVQRKKFSEGLKCHMTLTIHSHETKASKRVRVSSSNTKESEKL